ncbi:MAG TPA: hypothetical protein VK074_02750, partial [Fodinibius sp.]|nr:hypothetical protein [Fodinibius sp.]
MKHDTVRKQGLPQIQFTAITVLAAVLLLTSCARISSDSGNTLFHIIPPSSSNIDFTNSLSPTNTFNIYTYANFYSGAGVGLGDFNNDGLLDIYMI